MSLGPWEIFLILAVIVLLFGAGKLPKLMADVAEGVKAFKKGIKDEDGKSSTNDLKSNDPK
jgi:sec-independent protein translocase protein TatA